MTVCLNEIRSVITWRPVPRNTKIFKALSNLVHQHNVGQCVGCGTEWEPEYVCGADPHLSASNWPELE